MSRGEFKKAEELIRTGHLETARPILVKLCEDEPGNSDNWLYLAGIDEQFGLISEARSSLLRASALEPDAVETQFALARFLWNEGDLEAAMERSLAVFERDPAYDENSLFAARCQRLLHRHEPAIERLDIALTHSPGNPALWSEYLLSYAAAYGDERALDSTEKARQKFPGDERIRLICGRIAATCNQRLARELFNTSYRDPDLETEAGMWRCFLDGEGPDQDLKNRFIANRYDELSEAYDYHHHGSRRALFDAIRSILIEQAGSDPANARLVEAGCGTGLATAGLEIDCFQKTGLDLSGGMLARAVKNNRFDSVVRGAFSEAGSLFPERFDLVLAIDLDPYIEDVDQFLDFSRAVSAPGGLVVINTARGPGRAAKAPIRIEQDLGIVQRADRSGFALIEQATIAGEPSDNTGAEHTISVLRVGNRTARTIKPWPNRRKVSRRESGFTRFTRAVSDKADQRDASTQALYQLSREYPEKVDVWFQLGLAEQTRSNQDAAREAYLECLRLVRDHPPALFQLGVISQVENRSEDALEYYNRAIRADPRLTTAHYNVSIVSEQSADLPAAIDAARRAVFLEPWERSLTDNLHRLESSASKEDLSICRVPSCDSFEGVVGRAQAYDSRGMSYQVAELLEPWLGRMLETGYGLPLLVTSYRKLGDIARAEALCEQRLEKDPHDVALRESLAGIYAARGEFTRAIIGWNQACKDLPPQHTQHNNRLFMYNYSAELGHDDVANAHLGWGEAMEAEIATIDLDRSIDRDPGRVLRVGYVSADFREHAANCFFQPVLTHHDVERLEIFCYSNNEFDDNTTAFLRFCCDHWRRIRSLSDQQVAELVVRDRIDILVDLSGHTGGCRLGVFARQPAPVQISWIGYPNTTGLGRINYRLTDAWADPPGKTDHLHSEKLIRLPGAFHVFRPPPSAPATWSDLNPGRGRYTFVCSNNMYKVTAQVIETWSAILDRLPWATLVLKSHSFDNDELFENTWRRFERYGIARRRVRLMSALGHGDHLALMQRTEIGLDPFPYNGTTTTCDTLWMGVPVVVLAGDHHAARVGASIMNNIGLPELIATDRDQYVDIAVTLASDRVRLKSIQATLRDRIRCSGLLDYEKFVRGLEATYRDLWRRWGEQAEAGGTERDA